MIMKFYFYMVDSEILFQYSSRIVLKLTRARTTF